MKKRGLFSLQFGKLKVKMGRPIGEDGSWHHIIAGTCMSKQPLLTQEAVREGEVRLPPFGIALLGELPSSLCRAVPKDLRTSCGA